MAERHTRLIVESDSVQQRSAHTGRFFTLQRLSVARRFDRGISYNKLRDFSNTATCELFFRNDNHLESIALPQEMLHALATYLCSEKDKVSSLQFPTGFKGIVFMGIVTLFKNSSPSIAKWLGKKASSLVELQPPAIPYDCSSLAHHLNGIPYEYAQFNPEQWDYKRIDNVFYLNAGHTVLLGSGEEPLLIPKHFAIYIGRGLFLSKNGSDKLMVANLESMANCFDASMAVQAIPRKDS